jgi:CheY-like chemotaxis protein
MATVLVIDDSVVDRSLVGGLLNKDPSLTVNFAANGLEGLEQIAIAAPDLVITDLMMPEMDGLQFMAAVREQFPLVPVILMTSRGNEEIAAQALLAGAASYVPKRKLGIQLLDTVHQVLAVSGRQRGYHRLMGCIVHSRQEFILGNDSSLFSALVTYLQESATHLGLGDASERTRLGVALEEALANALYHGNLEINSSLRDEDDRAYYSLIEIRRQQEPYRNRRIYINAELSRDEARFVIRDEGKGFDPSGLPDPTDPCNLERASGRGILLMRTFMDEVSYNERGNEVRLCKRRAAKE